MPPLLPLDRLGSTSLAEILAELADSPTLTTAAAAVVMSAAGGAKGGEGVGIGTRPGGRGKGEDDVNGRGGGRGVQGACDGAVGLQAVEEDATARGDGKEGDGGAAAVTQGESGGGTWATIN